MNTNEEKEREAFEAFLVKIKWSENKYGKGSQYLMWLTWKAGRAALLAESEPVPEGEWRALPIYTRYKGETFKLVSVNYGTVADIGLKLTRYVNDEALGGFSFTAPQTEPKDTGSEI